MYAGGGWARYIARAESPVQPRPLGSLHPLAPLSRGGPPAQFKSIVLLALRVRLALPARFGLPARPESLGRLPRLAPLARRGP